MKERGKEREKEGINTVHVVRIKIYTSNYLKMYTYLRTLVMGLIPRAKVVGSFKRVRRTTSHRGGLHW